MRLLPLTLVVSLLSFTNSPAHAQYMYLDSNGDGVHTTSGDYVSPYGPTTFDIWLDTNHNRDGSLVTCNTADPISIFSYELILRAAGGTVTWGAYSNGLPNVGQLFSGVTSATDLYSGFFAGAAPGQPPGLYRIGSLSLTVSSGSPSIQIVPSTPIQIVATTSFGSACPTPEFYNTFQLGQHWFDVDGLAATCAPICPPFLAPIADMTADEGATETQSILAYDADGNPVTFQMLGGPPYMVLATIDPGTGTATGLITLTPGYGDAGGGTASVRATDFINVSNVEDFSITVNNINQPPIANPGGPYSGVTGVPMAFNGTGSSDPDGDALSFLWNFGDLSSAVGPTPVHTYAAGGSYTVSLTVSDGSDTGTAATVATITEIFPARAFTTRSNRLIRLGSGKATWSIQIEPVGRAYANSEVDLSSIRMKSAGTGSVDEISVQSGKTVIGSDADGNGAEEVTASFSKDDLRLLLENVSGRTTVPVTLEGDIVSGGAFRAQADIGVLGTGGSLAASVSPNPMNPEAVVTVFTTRPGFVRVKVLDLNGRLVRTLLDEKSMPAGYHEVRFNSRSASGEVLASGVYFYRVETAEGITGGKFTLLK